MQYDGSIRINTKINTAGVEKGTKEIVNIVSQVEKSISDIGKSASVPDAFKVIQEQIKEAEDRLNSLKEKKDLFISSGGSTDSPYFKEVVSDIEKAEKNLSSLEETLASVSKSFSEISQNAKNIKIHGLEDFSSDYKVPEPKTAKISSDSIGYNTDAIKHMEEYASKIDTLGKKEESRVNAIQAKEEARRAKEISAIQTETQEEERLSSIRENAVVGNQKIVEAMERRKQLQSEIKDLEKAGITQGYSDYDSRQSELSQINQKIKDYGKNTENVKADLKRISDAARNAFSTISKHVKKASKEMAAFAASSMKKAVASMLGLGKSAKKTNNTLEKGFKAILKYGLGIRSVYILINKFRTAVKEGFKNLAQFSDETNASLSSLKSSATQLKNSFATAFNPLLTAAAPALTAFINMVSKAVTYVGMLIAALTGKGTFTRAKEVQEDYAASLDKSADSAKKAEKATNGYLSGLDEVQRYEMPNDSDSGDSGGYKAPTPGEMFETVPIESSIKNLSDKIRSLIQSEDWEGLGAYMADRINSGLQKVYDVINWGNVGPRIIYFVNAFTDTFNSLVDKIDWGLLGRTIGAGINTVVSTLNILIEGIDWENLGSKFAEGINGIIFEVDWGNLGRLLGNKFMVLPRIALGFVKNLDWSGLGTAIGDSLNGLVKAVDLSKIGELLGRSITGIFQAAIDFSSTFDWNALGTNIANGINNFLSNFDPVTVAQGASDIAKGLLDSIITAIDNIEWSEVGENIATMLRNIDWDGIGSRLFEAGVKLISGLLDAFKELPAPVQVAITAIGGFFAAFKIASVVTAAVKTLGSAIALLTSPIGIAVVAIGAIVAAGVLLYKNWDTVKEKAKEVWDFVKKKFDDFRKWIGSIFTTDWTKAFGIFGNSLNAFLKNVSNIWDAIKKVFSGVITFISGAFSGDWEKAWKGIKDIFGGIWDGLVAVVKSPINAIIGVLNGLIEGMAWAVNGIADMLNSLRIDVPSWVTDLTGVSSLGFNLPKWNPGKIPYLATGAVIPPNREFLAVLGDQKSGTNIEAPEDLIRKIVREETRDELMRVQNQMGGSPSGGHVIHNVVQINRRTLLDEMVKEATLRQTVTGRNPFELA